MNYQRRFPPQKIRRKPRSEEGCKIILKKKKDGTIVKEIKGKCSREQLELLSKNNLEQKEETQ